MKKLLWVLLAVALVGWILYSNIQQQKAQDNKRTVYAVLPLTGGLSSIGNEYKTIIQFALREKNYPFNIVYIDSETNPSKGLTSLQQATVGEKNPIVFSFMSSVGSVIAPYIDKQKGFLFAVSSQSIATDTISYQQVATSLEDTLNPLIQYIKSHFNDLNVVYIMDEYGLAERNYLVDTLKQNKFDSIQELALPVNLTDPRNEVVKLLSKNPQAILILGNPTLGYINFFKNLRELNYKGIILSDATLTNPSVQNNLGSNANGTITVAMRPETETILPKAQQEIKNKIEKQGIRINSKPIQMLDTLELIKYTIENKLPFDRTTYEDLNNFISVSGDIVRFKKGKSSYPVILCSYNDGKFIPVESETK